MFVLTFVYLQITSHADNPQSARLRGTSTARSGRRTPSRQMMWSVHGGLHHQPPAIPLWSWTTSWSSSRHRCGRDYTFNRTLTKESWWRRQGSLRKGSWCAITTAYQDHTRRDCSFSKTQLRMKWATCSSTQTPQDRNAAWMPGLCHAHAILNWTHLDEESTTPRRNQIWNQSWRIGRLIKQCRTSSFSLPPETWQ